MAKLKGPLLSEDAHGSFGPRLTFSSRKSGSQVRYQKAQADRTTPARTTQRSFFSTSVGWWHELSAAEQAEWDTEAKADC